MLPWALLVKLSVLPLGSRRVQELAQRRIEARFHGIPERIGRRGRIVLGVVAGRGRAAVGIDRSAIRFWLAS